MVNLNTGFDASDHSKLEHSGIRRRLRLPRIHNIANSALEVQVWLRWAKLERECSATAMCILPYVEQLVVPLQQFKFICAEKVRTRDERPATRLSATSTSWPFTKAFQKTDSVGFKWRFLIMGNVFLVVKMTLGGETETVFL